MKKFLLLSLLSLLSFAAFAQGGIKGQVVSRNGRTAVGHVKVTVDVTGQSSVVIDGAARYMGLKVSTAKFDAVNLQTMATIADASHGAEVSLFVTERLEATTSTSAKISYKGSPSIIRIHSSLFGGEILATDK